MLRQSLLSVSANDYAADALALMQANRQTCACVIDRNEVVGMVRIWDLQRFSENVLQDRDVREYMRTDIGIIDAQTPTAEMEQLLRRNIGLAIMENRRFIGLLTREELSVKRQARLEAV